MNKMSKNRKNPSSNKNSLLLLKRERKKEIQRRDMLLTKEKKLSTTISALDETLEKVKNLKKFLPPEEHLQEQRFLFSEMRLHVG
jgi:hypothetical protein